LAATGFWLFLATSPSAAEDSKPVVRAALRVYAYILETEAMIDECRLFDIVNAASYDRVYQRYEYDISQTVIRLGFLVGQEIRHAGVDETATLAALDAVADSAVQTTERVARTDPERFAVGCKNLPNSMMAQKTPFEPLATKFPHELKVIQNHP
jgi:hypothetical protein